jgi:hypothetical protein
MNVMKNQRRQLFRDSAMKQYLQKREKDVLPQIVSPPVFAVTWLLVALLMIAGGLLWVVDLPVTSRGVISKTALPNDQAQPVLFVPQSSGSKIAVGQIVEIQIDTQTGLKGTVSSIGKVINPADASSQFGAAITTPSLVINVKLDKPLSAKQFAGKALTAKIEGLSQPVLSILFQS